MPCEPGGGRPPRLPERLANPGFGRRVLSALAGPDGGGLGLLVIDEAHAISDWGHDFRPDYRRVADVLRELHPDSPVLATTATANERVTADVARQLGSRPACCAVRWPGSRCTNVIDGLSPIQRYALVAQNIDRLPGSGIVYAPPSPIPIVWSPPSRPSGGEDYAVAAYSRPTDAAARQRLEEALGRNEIKALVATSALGMGYDKPDLGFVVHAGSPPSPVSYYQQVGRAGRALDEAVVMLLASGTDDRIWEYFATSSIPDPQQMATLLDAPPNDTEPTSIVALEAETGLRRTKIELMLETQLAVDGAADRSTAGWFATELRGATTRSTTRGPGGAAARGRHHALLCPRRALPHATADRVARRSPTQPCGRCSVCPAGATE